MNRTIINAWLNLPDPLAAEIFARAGFDTVIVDLQHGMHDLLSAVNCFRGAALHGTEPWARVPDNDPSVITRVLDAGATGIICPMISSPGDAAAFVAACRYPFDGGMRSFGPVRAGLIEDDYARRSAGIVTTLAMIENREGFENLDAIAATPGLDALYIGPSDLALAFGMTPSFENRDPAFLEMIDRIRDAAHANGLFCGIYTGSAEYAKEMLARGFALVTAATDSQLLASGAAAAIATVRADEPEDQA